MQGQRCDTSRDRSWPGGRVRPGRLALIALLVAVHAGLVAWMARPVAIPRTDAAAVEVIERIQLVAIEAEPAPPPIVHRPRLEAARASSRSAPVATPSRQTRGGAAHAPQAAGDHDDVDLAASRSRAAAPQGAFTPPSANRMPSRDRARAQLPGQDTAIVDGFHVRAAPSIEDRVLRVSAIFGGRRVETCEEVRQRLLGAGPGLARDMDIERLRRLCTN